MKRFAEHRKKGVEIAEKYYDEDSNFNEAFAEGFAIALTAKENVDASAGN